MILDHNYCVASSYSTISSNTVRHSFHIPHNLATVKRIPFSLGSAAISVSVVPRPVNSGLGSGFKHKSEIFDWIPLLVFPGSYIEILLVHLDH